jgi:hypothetical protein
MKVCPPFFDNFFRHLKDESGKRVWIPNANSIFYGALRTVGPEVLGLLQRQQTGKVKFELQQFLTTK